jgi:hypothetical protein
MKQLMYEKGTYNSQINSPTHVLPSVGLLYRSILSMARAAAIHPIQQFALVDRLSKSYETMMTTVMI